MAGTITLNASREEVWRALNDPEVLRQTIPGCETLDKEEGDAFTAKVVLKIGPVKAKFQGRVVLSDMVPPEGYTITGRGQGGIAGFAEGGAKVRLEEIDPSSTCLHYEVEAKVGGKLAQLGARLIDSTAKQLAGQFFEKFTALVDAGAPAAAG